ncbi:hypothetical protein HXX76_000734 [Chlamydomonas incerta]|uniref:Mitochondrial ribosomal protein S16 n=1 Tax=Chlamydomonas incerta TaxID=51695 RepID=A0A836B322_CHLIN|nr:hypothetical protein HXX76_000734 [Chlamydomonas incerta]|eukprot:KAG2446137.1 hypothetical protein HXX76_000734 [Chlamydomonas incerta]
MEKRQARNSGVRKEDVGWWDPNPAADGNMHLGLNFDRLKYWLTAGAKPTDKVAELLGHAGVLPKVPQMPHYNPRDPKDDTKWRPNEDK